MFIFTTKFNCQVLFSSQFITCSLNWSGDCCTNHILLYICFALGLIVTALPTVFNLRPHVTCEHKDPFGCCF